MKYSPQTTKALVISKQYCVLNKHHKAILDTIETILLCAMCGFTCDYHDLNVWYYGRPKVIFIKVESNLVRTFTFYPIKFDC